MEHPYNAHLQPSSLMMSVWAYLCTSSATAGPLQAHNLGVPVSPMREPPWRCNTSLFCPSYSLFNLFLLGCIFQLAPSSGLLGVRRSVEGAAVHRPNSNSCTFNMSPAYVSLGGRTCPGHFLQVGGVRHLDCWPCTVCLLALKAGVRTESQDLDLF